MSDAWDATRGLADRVVEYAGVVREKMGDALYLPRGMDGRPIRPREVVWFRRPGTDGCEWAQALVVGVGDDGSYDVFARLEGGRLTGLSSNAVTHEEPAHDTPRSLMRELDEMVTIARDEDEDVDADHLAKWVARMFGAIGEDGE